MTASTTSANVYDHSDALDVPLLPKEEEEESSAVIADPSASKAFTAIAGSVVALLSQFLLSHFLWDDSILLKPTLDILLFSLHWSCWTCAILFLGLVVLLQATSHSDEGSLFQMEAYYVVASLLTISSVWIFDQASMYVITVVLAVMIFQSTTSLLMTYSLVAGTLGLIFGVCSQFVLSLVFWKDTEMKEPIIENVIVFSLAWSLLTVVLTFMGCFSLRWIVENDLRAFLRMEAVYIAASLTGICGAWIFMDLTAGLPEQIIPSILMLGVSLAAFSLILWCFPEDKCLEEAEKELMEQEETKKLNNNKAIMIV